MAMAYIAILFVDLIGGAGTIFRKNFVRDNINVKNSLNIYMLLAHPVAALYFLAMAGGRVPLNVPSFWFSCVYAVSCTASVMCSMLAYDRINLIYISVFSSAGGMIIPFVFDLFRGEGFTVWKYISVAIRMAAVFVPIVFTKSKNRGLLIGMFLFCISGLAKIIPKLYGEWEGVVSDESFCFWTNILIMPIIVTLIFSQSKPKEIMGDMKKIRPSGYVYILLATAAANVGSLMSIEILRSISPTVYSILSSSLGMIITALISAFIYKEEINKQSVISLVLSVVAVVLGVM